MMHADFPLFQPDSDLAAPFRSMRDRWLHQPAAGHAERLRERLQRQEEARLLAEARAGRDVCWEDDGEPDPLVTVRIATYNRGALVVDRAIASALRQSHSNIEVLVVGDACDTPTSEAVLGVDDPRVRFVNLPRRGLYPRDTQARWMVAGAHPMNVALDLARGSWIAPCDDDDELTDDHVEVLLAAARSNRAELVYSRALMEVSPDVWHVTGAPPLRRGQISHGSVLYSTALRFFRHSTTSWKLPEPSDWNLWRRMRTSGVRFCWVDQITYRHYL